VAIRNRSKPPANLWKLSALFHSRRLIYRLFSPPTSRFPSTPLIDAMAYDPISSARNLSTEFFSFALACTGTPLLMSLQLMTEQRVGGWVQRQGRTVVPRRKSKVLSFGSQRVGRRRKSKIGRKAMPEGSATDESRRLGSRAELEGWQSAQAGSHLEGEAGRLALGESRRLAGRHSRRVGQGRKPMVGTTAQSESRPRRKSMVGTTVQSENRPEAQADGWSNGWAG
jgi:hypothetical protein